MSGLAWGWGQNRKLLSWPVKGEELDRWKRERKGCWGTGTTCAKYKKQEKVGQTVPWWGWGGKQEVVGVSAGEG